MRHIYLFFFFIHRFISVGWRDGAHGDIHAEPSARSPWGGGHTRIFQVKKN